MSGGGAGIFCPRVARAVFFFKTENLYIYFYYYFNDALFDTQSVTKISVLVVWYCAYGNISAGGDYCHFYDKNFGPSIIECRCSNPCARKTTKSSVGTSASFGRLVDGLP